MLDMRETDTKCISYPKTTLVIKEDAKRPRFSTRLGAPCNISNINCLLSMSMYREYSVTRLTLSPVWLIFRSYGIVSAFIESHELANKPGATLIYRTCFKYQN